MNKLFNTIISASVLLSTAIVLTTPSFAAIDAGALPSLNSATNGSTSISGNKMNVNVNAPQGGLSTFNWNSYNIGKDATVNYAFGHANQTALNLVSASAGMSQIYGKITQSTSCAGCDYTGTGKVILLNPNGVFFDKGSSVNLNSFTVSSFDGTYDIANKRLELTKGPNAGKIVINDGANLYGDKNLAIAAPNIEIYNGSKLTTNITPNVGNDSYGKIKLVTADGLNFNYYNNGAVKSLSDIKNSTDKMILYIAGELTSGNIDARNMSTNAESQINLNGAILKATQAVNGNDGNIYLTANNKIVVDSSTFKTENFSSDVKGNGGNIRLYAGNKVSVLKSNADAVGDITFEAVKGDSVIDTTTAQTAKDINLTAGKIASLQNNSKLKGKNVNVSGKTNAQVYASTIEARNNTNVSGDEINWIAGSTISAGNDANIVSSKGSATIDSSIISAKNINVQAANSLSDSNFANSTLTATNDVTLNSTAGNVELTSKTPFAPKNYLNLKAAKDIKLTKADTLTVDKTSFTAGKDIYLTSTGKDVNVKDTTKFIAADNIYISAADNAKTTGTVDFNNIKTTINAGKDVDVTLIGANDRTKGITVKAGNDVKITTPETLSVSSLISGNDMTITSDKVIAGLPYTSQDYPDKAETPRSYIEVKGTFTSNNANDNYDITHSYDPIAIGDKNYNQRHLIQYGEGAEKILLVNNRLYTPAPDPEPTPSIDANQALMMNKIPHQAERNSKLAPINDNRTVLTDVFAAASQIEIAEDEEEE